jgi:hypothetical protein
MPKQQKKAMPRYNQVFLNKYKDYPGIKASAKGDKYAHCGYCKTDFTVSHGGVFDIEKHRKGKGHVDAEAAARGTPDLMTYMVQPNQANSLELKVIRAETIITELMVKHNVPLSAADSFSSAFKVAFSDSEIAKKYACGRSKATALVKHLASDIKNDMREQMQTGPISIATDGSNDQKEKQFPIVVSASSLDRGVESKLLSVPILSGKPATGKISSRAPVHASQVPDRRAE